MSTCPIYAWAETNEISHPGGEVVTEPFSYLSPMLKPGFVQIKVKLNMASLLVFFFFFHVYQEFITFCHVQKQLLCPCVVQLVFRKFKSLLFQREHLVTTS